MQHLLLIQTTGPQTLSKAFDILSSVYRGPLTVIGTGSLPAAAGKARFLSIEQASPGRMLRDFFSQVAEEKVVMLNASLLESPEVAKASAALDSHAGSGKPFGYLPLKTGETLLDFPQAQKNALIPWLKAASAVPFLVISISRVLYQEWAALESEDLCEQLTRLFMRNLLKGGEVGRCPQPFPLAPAGLPGLALSNASRALLLRSLIESFNIEELFPAREWSKFPEESLAACYHSLAAMFLLWGDHASVESCLKQSEPLEDSPRAWALRGLLSLQRSEVLGATAHLISSLQQYEARKRDTGSHYLSFDPRTFEDINKNLKSGLEHLNRKENELAADCFLAAIFEFDPFYQEYGLTGSYRGH